MFSSWLCAPGRMEWVGGHKKREKGCVFCRVAKSKDPDKDFILKKTGCFFVVMNIYPYNTGHLMVVPIRHVRDLDELSESENAEMFSVVRKCVKLLKKVLDPVGFNMGINQGGSVSGASIDHLHVHVVPRFKTDFGFMDLLGRTKVLPEELSKTFERLKKESKMLE